MKVTFSVNLCSCEKALSMKAAKKLFPVTVDK